MYLAPSIYLFPMLLSSWFGLNDLVNHSVTQTFSDFGADSIDVLEMVHLYEVCLFLALA